MAGQRGQRERAAEKIITSHFHDGMPEFPATILANEYSQDVNQLADVATSATGISTLYEAT